MFKHQPGKKRLPGPPFAIIARCPRGPRRGTNAVLGAQELFSKPCLQPRLNREQLRGMRYSGASARSQETRGLDYL